MAAQDTPSSQQLANAIRALAMDAVQQANSGHPGAPMGMADMAVALWTRHLKHNPANPQWADRDRFVLSNGHASMLIYALLHLSGYDLPIEELRNFRQMHSKTPGHPEVGITPGVETTTGPLGQGITNAVGLALAEKLLASEFNRDGHAIVDHRTYTFLGDGCLMEGISHEACALAGAWKLNKLIALYDDNGISIDGQVAPWFIDDTAQRFAAYGWNVIGPVDGHDADAVAAAIASARSSADKPSLVICKTAIGKGSPNRANTAKAHGEPLGAEEIKLTREALGWSAEPFVIPADVAAAWNAQAAGAAAEAAWDERFAAYTAAFPELAAEFTRRMAGALPTDFAEIAVEVVAGAHEKAETVASRKASQIALETFTAALPELLGGSADLTGSNLTNTKSTPNLRFDAAGAVVKNEAGQGGRHINYGVREFGMAAIMNGVALHGGYIPYGGTFLTFSDYSRNAIRMAALMKLPRRPRFHPRLHRAGRGRPDPPVRRARRQPAPDPRAGCLAPGRHHRDRGGLDHGTGQQAPPERAAAEPPEPALRTQADADVITRGAYILAEPGEVGLKKAGQAVIIATGSEVQLALHAQAELAKLKIPVRVVSMPSTTVFDRQDLRVQEGGAAAQAAAHRRRGRRDRLLVEVRLRRGDRHRQLRRVRSRPACCSRHFGFTADNVALTVRKVLSK
jgi:transketolase